jgi:DNA repair protein RecN (Recombination protein N)
VLVELRIRDFVIIDSLVLPFAPGLNVLTGETGAGKSIIVGALSVLVGERAQSDLVRTGADKATVEGVFDLRARPDLRARFDERGVDVDDGTVVLKREIGASRTRAWANGSPVTATVLADLGRSLVNIHGQHEAQTLLDAGEQRRILDAFAAATPVADDVRAAHERWSRAVRDHDARDRRRAEASKREDWLRHVVREISEARLKPGEDATLAEEMRRLSHAEELRTLSASAAEALDADGEAVLARLGDVQKALASLQRIDPSLERLQEPFDAAYYQIEELARELAAYAESAESDPARLAAVEARRDLIFRLVKKYGGTEASALEQLDESKRELALLDDGTDGGASERAVRETRAALDVVAQKLTAARVRAAASLGREVEALFPGLGLADGRFAVEFVTLDTPGPDGAEEVHFTVALNAGHPNRALSRIASGGELARVMLALKTILARLDAVPTLIFDEVDAGIGGAVALQVGDAMRRVADHHQVFAITHLAQIAVRAHHHIVVAKNAKGGVTTAETSVVDGDHRVRELARMLGGDAESDVSRAHARELIAAAQSRSDEKSEGPGASVPRGARTREGKRGRR